MRGARVVQERAAAQVFTLRLPAATAAQQAQLGALGPALAGKVLQRCEEPRPRAASAQTGLQLARRGAVGGQYCRSKGSSFPPVVPGLGS